MISALSSKARPVEILQVCACAHCTLRMDFKLKKKIWDEGGKYKAKIYVELLLRIRDTV